MGETAKARLKTMRDTDDGFVIAEEDLRLRGPGEMLGKRQSGLEEFRMANPAAHADLLGALTGKDVRNGAQCGAIVPLPCTAAGTMCARLHGPDAAAVGWVLSDPARQLL